MRLKDLLGYKDIVIQCHDNPDADALASGFAVYKYLELNGVNSKFIYRGRNKITKSNLRIMVERLLIPVSYEPDYDMVPELLINVDCQHGQRNVTDTNAKTIAVIDHHRIAGGLPELNVVRSNIGSCATVIWDMMREEGLDPNDDPALATALYYGLYTDTNKLSEVSHPLDRDMIDYLTNANMALIREMSNSNLSLNELRITGDAIKGYRFDEKTKCLTIEAAPCDPNILGVISDFTLETENVDVTIAYYVSTEEIKFSVRSCTKTVHANDLAGFIAEGIGGAGGHMYKAGGMIRPDAIGDVAVKRIFDKRIEEYFSLYEIMYAKTAAVDMSDMKRYMKLDQVLGTVKLSDVFPEKSHVMIRTLEGDVNVVVRDDTYLMIGIEGEVYPISEEKLHRSYKYLDQEYEGEFEYEPSVKNTITGETKPVRPFARPVVSTGRSVIYAKPLTRAVKLFTAWDEERYYLGNVGDYIAVREDDAHDIYLVKGSLFDRLYGEC